MRAAKDTKEEKLMKVETKEQRFGEPDSDGIDRRGFLKCMAWAGTGALCVIKGGVLNSYGLGRVAGMRSHELQGRCV